MASGSPGAAESATDILTDATVFERAAGVELNLQDASSRIVADGAQLAGIDPFISMALTNGASHDYSAELKMNELNCVSLNPSAEQVVLLTMWLLLICNIPDILLQG